MAAESFWNNREQAQKLIDEAGSLRKKTEPLLKAEKECFIPTLNRHEMWNLKAG